MSDAVEFVVVEEEGEEEREGEGTIDSKEGVTSE